MPRPRLLPPLLLVLALAACGSDEDTAAPQTFPPLTYGYLTKLRLNVAAIQVQNAAPPATGDDVSAQSPVPPAQALTQMAQDRLFAAGTSGTAVFTIDRASILREPGGVLQGNLAAHLDILTAGGTRAGFAEMQVSREHTPGDDENRAQVLYGMTKQMLDDMNVELEFQVKRSLHDWLVPDAATPAPVQAAPLEGPPAAAPPPVAAPPALPPAVPLEQTAPAPADMSPPPGYLHLLPPG